MGELQQIEEPARTAVVRRPEPSRVLIAEDDAVTRRILENALSRWGYELTVCRDGGAAWDALSAEDPPRLVILDWMMPGMDGPEICRRLRERRTDRYSYILLLTGLDEPSSLVEGLEAGADDYLTKPFNPAELRMRLQVGQRILDLESRLLEAKEVLRYQATHDPLTGLWNRGQVLDFLERELSRIGREGHAALAFVLVDLDHFKSINDRHGHHVGDAVLRETGRRMRSVLRAYDGLGRYGGEEFAIILPGCSMADATGLAERMRRALSDAPLVVDEVLVRITASFGVAGTTSAAIPPGPVPASGESVADRLIKAADTALYRAKAAGRDRVVVAEDDPIAGR